MTGINGAAEIALEHHCRARLRDGAVRCWGGNRFGPLGDGKPAGPRLTPVAVLDLVCALEIEVGIGFSCAQTAGGVFCWGRNHFGQLGDETTIGRYVPGPVAR